MSTITHRDKVLVYLNKYKNLRIEEERYVTFDITQDGIASALNISRPHVSQILSGMVADGSIETLNSYVNSAQRPVKRKVYRLTASGRMEYQNLYKMMLDNGIDTEGMWFNFNNCGTDDFAKLSPEERNMYGCLCVLRIKVRREELGKNFPLSTYDHDGFLNLKEYAKSRFMQTGSPEDIRNWHSMAADWILDHGNDFHERLFHLNNARRDIEGLKLVRKCRHELFDSRIAESAKILAEMSGRCNEPELRRMAALLAIELNDVNAAKELIAQISKSDPGLEGAMLAELFLKQGLNEEALSLAQDSYRGDVDTGIALGKSLLANGDYLEAKDCLMWVKHEMIHRGDLFRMDDVLCCQAETECNLDCPAEALRIIINARSLTSNPHIIERLDALERSIGSVDPYSEDRVLLEGVDV